MRPRSDAASSGVERHLVPVPDDPVDRLAKALLVAAREVEVGQRHDRLVADVERPHAAGPVGRQPRPVRTQHTDDPAAGVGEPAEVGPRHGPLARWADRIGGHEAHPAMDGVGDEGLAGEVMLLVVAEGEVVEGAAPVGIDEAAGPDDRQIARPMAPVDEGPGDDEDGEHRQRQTHAQQGRGQEPVEAAREHHGLHPDDPFGHPEDGHVDGEQVAAVAVDGQEHLDRGRREQERRRQPADHEQRPRAPGRAVGRGHEGVPFHDEHGQQDQAQPALDPVDPPGEVQHGRDHQHDTGQHPGLALAPPQAPREREEHQPAQREEHGRTLGDGKRGEAEQEGQVMARRGQHRRHQVEDPDHPETQRAHAADPVQAGDRGERVGRRAHSTRPAGGIEMLTQAVFRSKQRGTPATVAGDSERGMSGQSSQPSPPGTPPGPGARRFGLGWANQRRGSGVPRSVTASSGHRGAVAGSLA